MRASAATRRGPEGRPVDITTESTESTESRFCGLRRAKRKEAVSVESVGRRVCRKAVGGGGFPEVRPVDDIDDSDDIDDPRTESRRRKVRAGSGTPEGARKAEGEGCALRRRVVDVVDVVGSSSGGRSKGQAAEEG